MLKNFVFFFLIIFSSFEIFQKKVFASCNFKTGNYINKLSNPSSIKDIKIKVNKGKNYAKNTIKTYLSNSTGGYHINSKYKKKFSSEISVNYDFGTCLYKGKVWQNGRWKDHIILENGQIIRSLNVKLDNGNILNATKFKLLIPRTRNYKNEILGTLILKNLGMISPETFEVSTEINDVKHIMIFQEDAQKELLERNKRREGPIFEADESLIWSEKQFSLIGSVGGGGLEAISLARMVNSNWFLNGESSKYISLSSLYKIQQAYLEYTEAYFPTGYDDKLFISPNGKKLDVFEEFNFLMLAMNGSHALRPHNRRYYFNSFSNQFEPIYYDGNLDFSNKFNGDKEALKNLRFSHNFIYPNFERVLSEKFFKNLKKDYSLRVINFGKKEQSNLNDKFKIFKKNMFLIQRGINQIDKNYEFIKRNNIKIRNSFLERNSNLAFEKNIIRNVSFKNKNIVLELEDGRNLTTNRVGLSKILSRKKLNTKRYLFLPEKNLFKLNSKLKKEKIFDSGADIIYPEKMKVIFEQDQSGKRLIIYQTSAEQSVLINKGDLKNFKIIFKGLKNPHEEIHKLQRLNRRGLTGCLNIYKSTINNLSIELQGGFCEDSLNIISSNGSLKTVKIGESLQDALDLDFSNVTIKNLFIKNAGNDCLDVSGGNYQIANANLSYCTDKAISIGEKSSFNGKKVFVSNSNIAIAVKDYSTANIDLMSVFDTPTCIEVFQKKQEFGGGFSYLKNFECNGKYIIDKNSKIKL